MGNAALPQDYYANQVKAAIQRHKIALESGESRRHEVDAALKEYAIHERNHSDKKYGVGAYVQGLYLLTLAKWTEPEKYKIAKQAYHWVTADDD